MKSLALVLACALSACTTHPPMMTLLPSEADGLGEVFDGDHIHVIGWPRVSVDSKCLVDRAPADGGTVEKGEGVTLVLNEKLRQQLMALPDTRLEVSGTYVHQLTGTSQYMGACSKSELVVDSFRWAKTRAQCAQLSIAPRLVTGVTPHVLELTITNPSQYGFEGYSFLFQENMIALRAIDGNGEKLRVIVPLIAPGTMPFTLKPGGRAVETYSLDGAFPELGERLKTTDVTITWNVSIEPLDKCYEEDVPGTLTIKRLPNA